MDYLIFKALNFNMDGIEVALICHNVMLMEHSYERQGNWQLISQDFSWPKAQVRHLSFPYP